MDPLRASLGTRMGRRIAATLALAACVPALLAALALVQQSARAVDAGAARALTLDAQAFAAELSARLYGQDDTAGLRGAAADVAADSAARLPPGTAAARSGGERRVALLDGAGRLLFSTESLPSEVVDMLARYGNAPSPSRGALPLAWQAAGVEWQGGVARVEPGRDGEASWSVVVFRPRPAWGEAARPVATELAAIGLAALLVTLLGTVLLVRRYVPLTMRFGSTLANSEGPAAPSVPGAEADELGEAIDAYNSLAGRLSERLAALETLGEIDRLLLASAELEQMFDSILSRVQAVTRCDGVAITLIDADSAAHGRVYFTAPQVTDLPVVRVELDPDMLATLAQAQEGITIARCEPGRHSLLRPLAELGAVYFWVWPVVAGERLVAALSLGFREQPVADPALARYGAEFAARLSVALSISARDERLYRQAHFDALTNLPNRLLFRDRLAQELASASAGGTRGALLYIDLDQFKRVNDSVGHGAGDQLLTIVAQRLRACVKDGDTVARLGGDEFTVVLRQVSDPDSVRTVAERIIAALEAPVNVAGRDHFVRGSIGITLFPDDGTNIDELMRNADSAMYRAKDLGRGRAVFFDRALTARQVSASGSGLYRALRHREFSLFYQPQFSLPDGKLIGLEALLRWQTPRNGLKYPAEFVPAAEETGLIVDIGGWVLEAACAQFTLWREQGLSPPRLALNVSALQLKSNGFVDGLRRLLRRHAIDPDLIELEFAETILADPAVGEVLRELAASGVRLALDDFGAGETSLAHLRAQPIGVVKIDRSLIEEIPQDSTAAALGATVIAMAHALGKTVVAEGVETIEQLDFLRERECDAAQGYYLARPLSAAAVAELLAGRIVVPAAGERLVG
ncbi:MAG: EAL domain-containing protein [Steroidobacteraceae bacterium]|nr:EAL domain-containing protein [Steroidobacteraceae bacterium]